MRWALVLVPGIVGVSCSGRGIEQSVQIPESNGDLKLSASNSLRIYEYRRETGLFTVRNLNGSEERTVLDFSKVEPQPNVTLGQDFIDQFSRYLILFADNSKFVVAKSPSNSRPLRQGDPHGQKSNYMAMPYLDDSSKVVPLVSGMTSQFGTPLKVLIGDKEYPVMIHGHQPLLIAMVQGTVSLVTLANKHYLLDLSTGAYRRFPQSAHFGWDTKTTPDLAKIPATATYTLKDGTEWFASIRFKWTVEHPTEVAPRNGTIKLANTRSNFLGIDGKTIEEAFYQLPSWYRAKYTGPIPERPIPQTRRDALDRSEVQVLVFDGKEVIEYTPTGNKVASRGAPYLIHGVPVFGLSSGMGDGVCYRIKTGVVNLSYWINKNTRTAAMYIGGGALKLGVEGQDIDAPTKTRISLIKDAVWKVARDGKEHSLSGLRSPLLLGTSSTGLAYIYDSGRLVIVDAQDGTTLSRVPAVEIALWPR